MPKRVDYPARYAFIRRAAFVVVRDHGPQALSRRAVAATLGTSVNSVRRLVSEDADLRVLALDEVDRLRRQGRWGRRGLAGPELAVFLLRTLLPDEEGRIPEELVGLHLAIQARRLPVPEDETVAALRAEHAIADRGYVPEGLDTTRLPVPDEPLTDLLAERLAERDAAVTYVVGEALAAIGVDAEAERRRTRALVSGLVVDTCLGRTTPEDAVVTLEHHLASLATDGARPGRPTPR
jgi:hypothetical protein